MLAFAGAASRRSADRLPANLGAALRTAFAAQVAGNSVETYEDAHVRVFLERQQTASPARFHHFVARCPGATAAERAWSLMFSGNVYDLPAGDTRAPDAMIRTHLSSFTPDHIRSFTGDFSLAICDAARDTIHLASSWMGVRPLYYVETREAVIWSSHLRVLRTVLGRFDIDRSFLVTFLARGRILDHTPYEQIRSVRPGCVLTFQGSAAPTLQDTTTFSDRDVVYRDEREYADHLYALVTRVIKDRMPDDGVCHTELSGGFDSSTITLLASQLATRASVALHALHYTSTCSPEWDERRYAAAVAHQARVPLDTIDFDDLTYLSLPDDVSPDIPNAAERVAAHRIRACGGQFLLSGRVGDPVFGSVRDNSLAAYEHFRERRYLTFCHRVLDWSIASNRPAFELGARILFTHWFPTWAAGWAPPQRGPRRTVGEDDLSLPAGAHDEANALTAAVTTGAAVHVRPAKRRLLSALLAYSRSRALENRIDGVTYVYPFVDKRLTDYVLSVPPELHAMAGQPRYLMRLAFADLWPAEVRNRRSKGYATPVTSRLFKPYAPVLLAQKHFLLADLRVLDVDNLRARLTRYESGAAIAVGNLEQIWCAEAWLRQLHGAPSLESADLYSREARTTPSLPPSATPRTKEVTHHAL